MSLSEKSFKQLQALVEMIAERFFMAKMVQHQQQTGVIKENDSPSNHYLLKVEDAYRKLDERERNLINNEFFYQNYHYWWVGLYSKTSFYRFKKRAMLKFLEAFYHV